MRGIIILLLLFVNVAQMFVTPRYVAGQLILVQSAGVSNIL